jgi:hypothetical protein
MKLASRDAVAIVGVVVATIAWLAMALWLVGKVIV